jgi:hypothetical protein
MNWHGGGNSSQGQDGEYYRSINDGYTFVKQITDYEPSDAPGFRWQHGGMFEGSYGALHVEAELHISGSDFSKDKMCWCVAKLHGLHGTEVPVLSRVHCGTLANAKRIADEALGQANYARCVLSKFYSEINPELSHILTLDGTEIACLFRSYWDAGTISYRLSEYFNLRRRWNGDDVSRVSSGRGGVTSSGGDQVREEFKRMTGQPLRRSVYDWRGD